MRGTISYFFGFALSALMLSCVKETSLPCCPEGEKVDVTLNVQMVSDVTKSLNDSEEISSIKNIWVIQYNGTADDAKLIGSGTYLDENSISVEEPRLKIQTKLVSVSKQNVTFFIANSFNTSLVFPKTLREMKSYSKQITKESDLFGSDGDADHMIYSGWAEMDKIEAGSELQASLERNVAKLTLKLINSSTTSETKITINGVRICSVPDASYYFPSYGSPSIFPETVKSTIEYPLTEWPDDVDQASGDATAIFSFYLPVNKRGTVENAAPSEKGRFNPGNATYALIECTYPLDGVDVPISYVYFLGENLVNDFNIENNRIYSFDLEIKDKGTPDKDFRIRDEGPVDYGRSDCERANCYILNPPRVDGYWRTYKIPVDRINTFWGKTSPLYECKEEYQLSDASEWEASIVWADFDLTDAGFRFEGGGDKYTGSGTNPISVQVKKGTSGNVVVGLKKKGDGLSPYLWSWHLWITDYEPDNITRDVIRPISSVYDYPVTGGKVHRLECEIWESGIYRNAFMMDRNVGALDTEYHDKNTPGTIMYQFGRKDPLFLPKSDKNISCAAPEVVGTEGSPTGSIYYSIAHPDVYLLAEDYYKNKSQWTRGNKYNPDAFDATILWQDPNATIYNHRKSIFDPCPVGWKVPEDGVFACLTSSEHFPMRDHIAYYRNTQKFPLSGYRNCVNGKHNDDGGDICAWYSQPSSVIGAHQMYTGVNPEHPDGYYNVIYSSGRSYAYSVRCVSEN